MANESFDYNKFANILASVSAKQLSAYERRNARLNMILPKAEDGNITTAKDVVSALANLVEGVSKSAEDSKSQAREAAKDLKAARDAYNQLVKQLEDKDVNIKLTADQQRDIARQIAVLADTIPELEKAAEENQKKSIEASKRLVAIQKNITLDENGNGKHFWDRIKLQNELDKERLEDLKEKRREGTITTQESKELKSFETQDKTLAVLNKISNSLEKYVDNAMELQNQYMGKIDARVQGLYQLRSSDYAYDYKMRPGWNDLFANIRKITTANPYVSQARLIEEVSNLTQSGIMYNIEQRALLSTLSDKMVSTFEVMNASLLRMTRLQGADLTTPSLGAEASLLKFLNSSFKDSSYLNDVYDGVRDAILEATSQMQYKDTTEFEYTVQKWLGALYSVGASQSTISTIAQGIGYLGSGNISALSGNTQLQNLLALSANKGGLSYSEMLTKGLTAETTNTLLKSMVEYLSDIATNTEENNVLRQAFGGILNLSISDIKAFSNLSTQMIENISSETMNYSSAIAETYNQAELLRGRTTIAEKVNNVLNNVLTDIGFNISDNAATYGSFKLGKILSRMGGEGGLLSTLGSAIRGTASLFGLAEEVKRLWDNRDLVAESLSGELLGIGDWQETMQSGTYYGKAGNLGISINTQTAGSYSNAQNSTPQSSTSGVDDSSYQSRTATDIYHEIFEKKTAIKTTLDMDTEKAANKLFAAIDKFEDYTNTMTTHTLKLIEYSNSIKNKLVDGTIKVDVVDNDVNAITSAINSMRNYGGVQVNFGR